MDRRFPDARIIRVHTIRSAPNRTIGGATHLDEERLSVAATIANHVPRIIDRIRRYSCRWCRLSAWHAKTIASMPGTITRCGDAIALA